MQGVGEECERPWDGMEVDEVTQASTSWNSTSSCSIQPSTTPLTYVANTPAGHAAIVGGCNSGGKLTREGVGTVAYHEPESRGGAAMGGGANKKAGLRRSFSHSNLHDRSASLDRPSVIQCIKAIGFIFEHMAREDSYRERGRGFDFSAPAGGNRMEWDQDEGRMMGESGVSGEEVSGFLDSLYCLCKWTPECNIMALILIIRLFQYNPDLTLHEANWKRLLLTALMIAQKTWDDRALMNRDFPAVWSAVAGSGESGMGLEEVNELEREFFRRLDHHLFIAPAMYASTYFELCSLVPSEEAIKNQLHQLIQVAGANVRVVQSQKTDPSFCYNTAEVIYSPNVPIHGGAARVALPPGNGSGHVGLNGSGHVGLNPEAQAMNTDQASEGGVVRRLYGWLG